MNHIIKRIGETMNGELRRAKRRSRVSRRPTVAMGATTLMALSTIGAVSAPASSSTVLATQSETTVTASTARTNDALDALAKALANAVAADNNLLQQIHATAGDRFDGDTNVLYKTLVARSGVRQDLASAYAKGKHLSTDDALQTVDRLTAAISRFQIAVPVHFDSWDATAYTPMVAYVPDGVEDTQLETIAAYDAAGTRHQLDAQVAPDRPVIVLGMNERTDNSGKLLQRESRTSAATTTALSSRYIVRMAVVHLHDDKEPWAKGDAEIALKAKSYAFSSDCGTEYHEPNWPLLDNSGDSWAPTSGPMTLGDTCADVGFGWWENDGPDLDYDLKIGDYSLGIRLDNDDDLIGRARVAHSTFEGASIQSVTWDALTQWTD